MQDALIEAGVHVHDLFSEPDLNHTWIAYSGSPESVAEATLALARLAFEALDLNRLPSAVPRTGALDRVLLFGDDAEPLDQALAPLLAYLPGLAADLDGQGVPLILIENSSMLPRDAEIARMQHEGFGSLLERAINSDLGPTAAHPRLGIVLLGVGNPRIVMGFAGDRMDVLKGILEAKRNEGSADLMGAEFESYSRPASQDALLIATLTMPDITAPDDAIAAIQHLAAFHEIRLAAPFLIGAIRQSDVDRSGRLRFRRDQLLSSAT